MNKKLDLNGKLDFSDIDLTAPDKVVKDIISELSEETKGIVCGKIEEYDGQVMSYTKRGLSGFSTILSGAASDKYIDIQTELGKFGEETHKYECYIYTPQCETYKYRVFFMKYDISNYPAKIILEESVANSVSGEKTGYIFSCANRAELEDLVVKIFTSKRIVSVMQELIRIHQAKKIVQDVEEINDTETDE